MVLSTRIELVIQSYQDCGMPLTYKSLVVIRGNDPLYEAYETPAYPSRLYHLVACQGIDPWSLDYQSSALPLS